MKTWIKVVLGFAAVGSVVSAIVNKDKPPPDPVEQKKASERYVAKEFSKQMIAKKLRDPSSATFDKIDAYTRSVKGETFVVVCGSVNAKNGFGGYTGLRDFLTIPSKNVAMFESEGHRQFVDLWNSLCAGKL